MRGGKDSGTGMINRAQTRRAYILTIGSRNRSWNGLVHDNMIVLGMDFSWSSMGALYRSSPVSFRNRRALFRRQTGWYVSGTSRIIASVQNPDQIINTQKDHLQSMYWFIKPPMRGPSSGLSTRQYLFWGKFWLLKTVILYCRESEPHSYIITIT